MFRLACSRVPLRSGAWRDLSTSGVRSVRSRARVENIPSARVRVQETVGQKGMVINVCSTLVLSSPDRPLLFVFLFSFGLVVFDS